MDIGRPRLRNIEAFRRVLADYKMSAHACKVLRETRLVVMSGVAGGGRNTVINELTDKHGYHFIVSDTTRPPKMRDGRMEQNGVQYFFRSEQEILDDLRNGEFLEAEIIHNQQVSGISVRELERANRSGKIAINEIEYGGINNIAQAKPDVYVIGLLPPSYKEWIRRFRGREELHEQEFLNRLRTAEKVLENMVEKPYYKIVVNDNLQDCVRFLRKVVEGNEYNEQDRLYGVRLARDMLAEVRAELKHAAGA